MTDSVNLPTMFTIILMAVIGLLAIPIITISISVGWMTVYGISKCLGKFQEWSRYLPLYTMFVFSTTTLYMVGVALLLLVMTTVF